MTSIYWDQHPAGHGGFHTGVFNASDGTRFTWAFDCGSRANSQFDKYLRDWSERHRSVLDWLFISHFDTDHASGLDTLMLRTEVRNVMVPYLENHELVLLLLHEINRGSFTRSTVELVADSAAYFLSRGASNVTFLGNGGTPGELDPSALPPEGPEDSEGWRFKIVPPALPAAAPPWVARPLSVSPVSIIDGGMCDMILFNSGCGLHLKPYRAPVTDAAQTQLLTEIEQLVRTTVTASTRSGIGKLAYAVANHARTSKGRAQLRQIYAAHAGSSNRSSLSLMSIPIVTNARDGHWEFGQKQMCQWAEGNFGWINTGDAELLASSDLADWEKCYSSFLDRIAVLALPHHGSDRNSNEALQKLFPKASFLAHVKSGNGKHPGAVVTLKAGQRLCCVTEKQNTTAHMTFHFP